MISEEMLFRVFGLERGAVVLQMLRGTGGELTEELLRFVSHQELVALEREIEDRLRRHPDERAPGIVGVF